MKLIATVFENSLVLFLLEICDTGRCRESVLEYLVVYLKDDDSKFAKKGRNKSCSNWYLFCTASQITQQSTIGHHFVADGCSACNYQLQNWHLPI